MVQQCSLSILSFFPLKKEFCFFLLFHMYEGFAYVYICTLHVCLVPANPSFRFLGTKASDVLRHLELNPDPLHEQEMFLTLSHLSSSSQIFT